MNRLITELVHGVSRLAFWRKPAAPFLQQPAEEASAEQPAETEREPAASADASQPRVDRFERACVLAALSSKRVWIPGAAVMLLGLVGAALALTPPQAAPAKEHRQAERAATQEKREQTGVVKKRVAVADAPARIPAEVPALATGGGAVTHSRPSLGDADCQVSDKASVTRNLKNCIDSFNRSTPGRADRATRKPVANRPREI